MRLKTLRFRPMLILLLLPRRSPRSRVCRDRPGAPVQGRNQGGTTPGHPRRGWRVVRSGRHAVGTDRRGQPVGVCIPRVRPRRSFRRDRVFADRRCRRRLEHDTGARRTTRLQPPLLSLRPGDRDTTRPRPKLVVPRAAIRVGSVPSGRGCPGDRAARIRVCGMALRAQAESGDVRRSNSPGYRVRFLVGRRHDDDGRLRRQGAADRGGRLVALFWMFTSLVIISGFTASIASSLTLGALDGPVQNPDDLRRVRVATVSGSSSVDWLAKQGVAYTRRRTLTRRWPCCAKNGPTPWSTMLRSWTISFVPTHRDPCSSLIVDSIFIGTHSRFLPAAGDRAAQQGNPRITSDEAWRQQSWK